MIEIIDDFFDDLKSIENLAREAKFQRTGKTLSGEASFMRIIPYELHKLKIPLHLKFSLPDEPIHMSNCRFKMAYRKAKPERIHSDYKNCMTLVVYLNDEPTTAITFHTDSGPKDIPMKKNRAVFFDSAIPHQGGPLFPGRLIFIAFLHKGHKKGELNVN